MKILKKNQIVVFVIGIMIIAAGYLNFTNNASLETGALADSEELASIGDAKLVSANVVENTVSGDNTINNEVNTEENKDETKEEKKEKADSNKQEEADNTIKTNSSVTTTDEYFTNSRLERNTMYSQQIENYQNVLSNTNVSEAQKKTAQEEITRINNEQNAIMIAENLIKTKGIEDIMIFVNDSSVNAIIKGEEPKKEEIAQIQNIITRELKAKIENIHIMNKK